MKQSLANFCRHESRFGITSFVYRSRRPFHPGRLYDQFMDPHFIMRYQTSEGPEDDLAKLQEEAAVKGKTRKAAMGEVLRSKGFVWMATSSFIMGAWQQAGNILRYTITLP